jgi:hypothetical protein
LRERTVRRVRAQLGHDRDHNALNRHFERERGIILDVNMIAVPVLPALLWLVLIPCFHPLIQRLQHARIHCGDHIDGSVQFFLRHARFPCVRKAPVHSRIAKPHHRDGKTDEHFFPFREALHCMSIPVERSKVRFLQGRCSSGFASLESRVSSSRPETLIYAGFTPVISA